MKKHFILSVLLMFSFLMSAQETVTLKFTSNYRNGSNMPFDYVIVKDITHNWLELLSAPDTIIVLTAYDGIDELDIKGGLLSEAFPNPFSGNTNLMYSIEKSQQVKAQLLSFNGQLLSMFDGFLDAGTYMFTIEMDRPQMAFFIVTSGNNKCYKKVLNIGAGNNNKIEVNKIVGNNQSRDVRVGDFVIGDLMEYEAVVYDNGNDISRVITQNQYGDEIISFTFDLNVPTVTTYAVGNISQTTGMSGGIVTSNGGSIVTERGICWNTNHNPTINDNHANNGSGNGDYIITMTNLVPGTTYYVRAYAINSVGIAYGNEVSFTTSQNNTAPTVTTNQVTDITQTTAVSGGNVTSDGGAAVTARGICWSTNHNPTTSGNHTTNGTGTGSFTANITGLIANTTYYVRAYATNNVGTAYGNEVSFTTSQNNTAPTVTTNQVTDITQTTAVSGGNVTSDGGAAVTARGICWSTNHNPTTSGNHTTNGTGTGSFTANITGLIANTTYYVRAYAINSVGTAYGSEVSFTTHEELELPDVSTNNPSNITQTTATSGGRVLYDGNGTVSARGVCWSTSPNPSISDAHTSDGSGLGMYASSITGLTPNTTYYVRAYATNELGTGYGPSLSFTTLQNVTAPIVTTSCITNITQTTATGGGNVTSDGGAAVTSRGICWSTNPNPTISGNHTTNGTGTGSFSANITGLTANTTYYVRAYATNSVGTSYGSEVSFTTSQNVIAPTVTTSSVTNITQTTATGGGNVTSDGGATVTTRGICWSTNPNPTISGNHTTNGTGTGSFSANITGLTANTTYYVRAYATNSVGTSYGSEVSFTTSQNVTAPIVTTSSITNITQTTATGSGNVTSDGGATVTSRGVCWSTGHNPTTNDNHTTNGTGTGNFTVNITGLTANTTYYVRAYATNSVGTSYGNEVSFTTLQNATVPTVSTNYNVTNITPTTAICGGNVTSDGGTTVTSRGICWSTNHNPTISGYHTTNGTGTGSFTANMTGLNANTTYYVRAYATNSVGTSYGGEVSFTTQQLSTYTISVMASPSYGGNVSGGGNYVYGQTCTVHASAKNGFVFTYWTKDGVVAWDQADFTFIVYGNETLVAHFTGQTPTGTTNGVFSVSATQQVFFSIGNLQYKGSTSPKYWKFADHQWDVLGISTNQSSSLQSADRDLFGWGTSNYNHGAVCYQPWSTSTNNSDYYAYGNYNYNLNNQNGRADWGYNSISNGGNTTGIWRTLTIEEWQYVFNTRVTNSGIRYAKAKVNNVNGIILLPDHWSTNTYTLSNTNTSNANYDSNIISASQWSILENAGAVFLPAAGYRNGTSVPQTSVGSVGCYWSASRNSYTPNSSALYFNNSNLYLEYNEGRSYGYSVRLVRNAD